MSCGADQVLLNLFQRCAKTAHNWSLSSQNQVEMGVTLMRPSRMQLKLSLCRSARGGSASKNFLKSQRIAAVLIKTA